MGHHDHLLEYVTVNQPKLPTPPPNVLTSFLILLNIIKPKLMNKNVEK